MKSEQAIPMDSIKDIVRSSMKVSEFNKHPMKAYRLKHCGNNNKDEDNSSKTLNDKKILSLSLRCTNSMDFLDFVSSSVPIGHCSWQVLSAAPSVCTEQVNVFAGQPTLVSQYVGLLWRMLLGSSSLLYQKWPAQISWMVLAIGGK